MKELRFARRHSFQTEKNACVSAFNGSSSIFWLSFCMPPPLLMTSASSLIVGKATPCCVTSDPEPRLYKKNIFGCIAIMTIKMYGKINVYGILILKRRHSHINHSWCFLYWNNGISLLVLEPVYYGITRPIAWLVMCGILTSPGYQWPCSIRCE